MVMNQFYLSTPKKKNKLLLVFIPDVYHSQLVGLKTVYYICTGTLIFRSKLFKYTIYSYFTYRKVIIL